VLSVFQCRFDSVRSLQQLGDRTAPHRVPQVRQGTLRIRGLVTVSPTRRKFTYDS
jgi:hypothetical protein